MENKRYEVASLLEREIPDYTLLNYGPNLRICNKNGNHFLHDYSVLNIDAVVKCICDLFKEYKGIDKEAIKVICQDLLVHSIESQQRIAIYNPYCIVADKNDISKFGLKYINGMAYGLSSFDRMHDMSNLGNIIWIQYPTDIKSLFLYPKSDMFIWKSIDGDYTKSHIASGYSPLINAVGKIQMCNYNTFIGELIYSLAYHQYKNGIKYMNAEETKDAFKRIYRK